MDELKHDHELKLHHYTTTKCNYDKIHTELVNTQDKLDKSIAQICQMKKMQKSQVF